MYAESVTPYIYSDTMGTCNKAALIHFVSDDALELTVVIRDPENPGNVTNSLLTSQTAASIPRSGTGVNKRGAALTRSWAAW